MARGRERAARGEAGGGPGLAGCPRRPRTARRRRALLHLATHSARSGGKASRRHYATRLATARSAGEPPLPKHPAPPEAAPRRSSHLFKDGHLSCLTHPRGPPPDLVMGHVAAG
jgi:hypothetical protein